MADDAQGFQRVDDGVFKKVAPSARVAEGFERITPEHPGFIANLKSAAGKGLETITESATHPERHTFSAWPGIVSGALQIVEAPISAAGAAIEERFPRLKEAQKQGQILPLESPADVIGTGLSLIGGRAGVKAPAAAPAEASMVRKILSPASVPEGEKAAAGLREATGTAARDTAKTQAAMAPYEARINQLPPDRQLDLLGYMEGRSKGAKIPDPALQSYADEFRNAMKLREDKIKSSPEIQAGIIEDYVTHFWKDPSAARSFVTGAKTGSGRFLKERTIPTIEEGIRAGLEPITNNPTEILTRYITTMDRHIAMKEFMAAAEDAGSVKFFRRGANDIPEGWQPLNGPLSEKGMTRAYAPEMWAHVYNNFVSRGVYGWGQVYGDAYNAFRNASNMTTQTVLALSGYHVAAMAEEAVLSQAAKGVSQIVGGLKSTAKGILRGQVGEILRGGTTAAKGAAAVATSPAAPITTALKGRKFQQVYLGRTPGSPDYRHIVDRFTKAGGRAVGKGHAPDYQFSSGGSYFSAWKRGSLKMELRGALKDIGASNFPPFKAAQMTAKAIGRAFETLSDPLFKEYIPMLKSGAFYDTMKAWLEANPAATYDEQMGVARRIVDSIDNRFGEMIQDNIFWGTLAKQAATVGMLSYSWNLGTVRELMGGALATAKTLGKGADIASSKYDPRVAYVIAFPMVIATINGIYQYIKTGKPPQSAQDLMAPQTGGTAPGFGGHGQVPERAILPGYQKDVFGWYWNPITQEGFNKLNPLTRMGIEMLTKKDWRDDPIIRPDPTVPQWLEDYFTFVLGSLNPIATQRLGKGEKTGSAMGKPEEFLGIRPAPGYLQDPEGYMRGMSAIEKRKWMLKQAHDRAQQHQYGGTQE